MAWFYGLFLFANASAGIRTGFVRKHLGLGHNSSVRLCRLIRIHMASMPRAGIFGGDDKIVHIDEVYLRFLRPQSGGKHTAAIVLGMACDGKVMCGIVPDRRAKTLMPLILDRVQAGSTIVTDMHKAYLGLERHGYRHIRIDHSRAFHDFKGNTNNEIEVFWASVRRNLRLYQQTSVKHLWTYLAEIEFHYNRRHSPHSKFDDLITRFQPFSEQSEAAWHSRFDWVT